LSTRINERRRYGLRGVERWYGWRVVYMVVSDGGWRRRRSTGRRQRGMSFSISGRSESSWDPEITLLFMAGFIFQFLSKIYRGLNANLVYITDNAFETRARIVCSVRASDLAYVLYYLRILYAHMWKVHVIIIYILIYYLFHTFSISDIRPSVIIRY